MVRVLVVDDSDAIRLVLKDILTIGKHELVGEGTNGEDAVQLFVKTKPEVTLLDMAMPKKDGLSALKEILSIDPKAKIVVITASDNQSTIRECINAGACSYIIKPFDFQNVLKTISDITHVS